MSGPKQALLAMRDKLPPAVALDVRELTALDKWLATLDCPVRGVDAAIARALILPPDDSGQGSPLFTSSIEAAFGAAFIIAPGWVFLSLAQDVTAVVYKGDLVKPTGRWFAKWQVPTGGLLQIGSGRLPTTAILRGAIACRLARPDGVTA